MTMMIQPNIVCRNVYSDSETLPNGKAKIESFFCADLVTMQVRYFDFDEVRNVCEVVFFNKISYQQAAISLFYKEIANYYV